MACELLRRELDQGPKKIYELTQCLVRADIYPWSQDPLIGLYQKLFITQSALCELYYQLEETDGEGGASARYLHLTPVIVSLRARNQRAASAQSGNVEAEASVGGQLKLEQSEGSVPNFAFFSNEQNFFGVSAEDVKDLLTRFWTQYEAHFSQAQSLELLALDKEVFAGVTSTSQMQALIRSAYRKAAAQHHPDRGGDPQAFIAIRSAYEQLMHAHPKDVKPDS